MGNISSTNSHLNISRDDGTINSRNNNNSNLNERTTSNNIKTTTTGVGSGGGVGNGGNNNNGHQETSRMLFLLYLINRTWNVMIDSVDNKGKR